jgi:hypothetical protein
MGCEGFILVPHTNGRVARELLEAVKVYDPDYVVALQRTLQTEGQAVPDL